MFPYIFHILHKYFTTFRDESSSVQRLRVYYGIFQFVKTLSFRLNYLCLLLLRFLLSCYFFNEGNLYGMDRFKDDSWSRLTSCSSWSSFVFPFPFPERRVDLRVEFLLCGRVNSLGRTRDKVSGVENCTEITKRL